MEIKDSEERSEKVRAFRRRRLAAYEHAYDTWLPDSAEVIDTTSLAPADVAARVLTFLPLA